SSCSGVTRASPYRLSIISESTSGHRRQLIQRGTGLVGGIIPLVVFTHQIVKAPTIWNRRSKVTVTTLNPSFLGDTIPRGVYRREPIAVAAPSSDRDLGSRETC